MKPHIILGLCVLVVTLGLIFQPYLQYNPQPDPVEDRVYLFTGVNADGSLRCIPGYPSLSKDGHDRMNAFFKYIGHSDKVRLRCP